jgi:hypothetical protein
MAAAAGSCSLLCCCVKFCTVDCGVVVWLERDEQAARGL